MEHFLEHQLGFPVGIDGPLRQILGHGHAVRRPVGRASGTEDKLLDAGRDGSVQQVEAVGDIVAEVLGRIDHRLADQGVGGKMDDGLRLGVANGPARYFSASLRLAWMKTARLSTAERWPSVRLS